MPTGDPVSYSMIEAVVTRLASTGAVRHAPECFNYTFPQEIDDHFLVISDALPNRKLWTYMKVKDLQEFLLLPLI